jgi:hypothetical protein
MSTQGTNARVTKKARKALLAVQGDQVKGPINTPVGSRYGENSLPEEACSSARAIEKPLPKRQVGFGSPTPIATSKYPVGLH